MTSTPFHAYYTARILESLQDDDKFIPVFASSDIKVYPYMGNRSCTSLLRQRAQPHCLILKLPNNLKSIVVWSTSRRLITELRCMLLPIGRSLKRTNNLGQIRYGNIKIRLGFV